MKNLSRRKALILIRCRKS